MKKSFISLLSLSAMLAITGCSTTTSYKKVIVEPTETPTKLHVEEPGLVMFVGEKQQVHVNVFPLTAANTELVYKSNKTGVATVDKNGLITAKGGGTATIRISAKGNPDVYEEVVVAVEKNRVTSSDRNTAREQKKDVNEKLKNQKKIQQEKYYVSGKENLDKVAVYNGYILERTRDGEHYYSDHVRQDFIACKSLGFFHFDIKDVETRSPGGNPAFSSFGYYMFCNENFDAHAYKYDDSSAKRAYVSAEDYIGKVDRIEVVMMMLDNIFTSQRRILTNQFSNALENGYFSATACTKGGYTNDGKKSGGYYKAPTTQPYTISADDESDLEIPAGTRIDLSQGSAYHWTDGRIDASFSSTKFEYDLDGHHYVYSETAYTKVYIEDEVEIVYPNKDDYQEVPTFIDLFA